jgi:hypothetical protein
MAIQVFCQPLQAIPEPAEHRFLVFFTVGHCSAGIELT